MTVGFVFIDDTKMGCWRGR